MAGTSHFVPSCLRGKFASIVIVSAILLILLTIPALRAFPQDSVPGTKERNYAFNGYIKDMQTVVIHTIGGTWITNNLIHNRNNFRWNISNNFTPDFDTYIPCAMLTACNSGI